MSKYIACWSGGKDSTASIILAHEYGEPIDEIIFSEVMFDEKISGEPPEHIEFIQKTIKRFQEWGYKVTVLHSEKTYTSLFYHVISRGKHKGMVQGFPMRGKCCINDRCKTRPIHKYMKNYTDVVYYVGIAVDEPKRLARLKPDCVSLLVKYNRTEQQAHDLCKEYGMLSPWYKYSKRCGCWFCPNAKDEELRYIRKAHPELWEKLVEMEQTPNMAGYCWDILHKVRIADKEKLFSDEEYFFNMDAYNG